ncbi:unnamed protein product [Blepharisma stoltei]|uniref:Dickkopf N-terminal cysteine-rich domain-containing protein n=1 Tax=Blepharisma stoltei TaxID=1481888 RepID=A0AAU9IYR6_9CILI|nr:unnamed protein product [Blepharisma stoltei]
MAYVFIFMIWFASSSAISQNYCWSYKCKDSEMGWDTLTCVYSSIFQSTYFLNPCSYPFYCPLTQASQQNITCIEKQADQYESYPGEPCNQATDCAYGNCVTNKCVGSLRSESCSSHADCDVSLRCYKNRCTSLIKAGETGCTSDYDCYPNSGCNIIGFTGTCIEYFSLPSGSYISSCSRSKQAGFNYLCSSGVCLMGSFFTSIGTCIDAPVSKQINPQICSADSDCAGSTSSYQFTSTCTCGMNPYGTSYCQPFYGDTPYLSYFALLKDFMNSSALENCNTLRRFNENCWKLANESESLISAKFLAENYPLLQNNDDCTEIIYFKDYYGIEENAVKLPLSIIVFVIII